MIAFLGFMFAAAVTQGHDPQTAKEISDRARELYDSSQYTEAEPLFRQALEAWRRLGPEGCRNRAIDLRNLGALLRATGRYGEAEPLLLESLHELQAADDQTVEVERALYNLAALYRGKGDLSQAELYARDAVTLVESRPEAPTAEKRGPGLVLASIYLDEGRVREAESLFRGALPGADGALAVAAYNGLSASALLQGDYAAAEESARQAVYFARLALPAGHPALAAAWNNLAQACRLQSKYLEAESGYRQAIRAWEATLGPSHPLLAQGLMNFGAFYHERGRETGAEALYLRAAGILEQAFGKDDPRTLEARNELAEVLRAERRYTESEKLGRSTLAALRRALRPDDPRLMRAQSNYARLQATKKGE